MRHKTVFVISNPDAFFGVRNLNRNKKIFINFLNYHKTVEIILYFLVMINYKYTAYFENEVLRKRPYIKKEWCISVLKNPVKIEKQENNRFRIWGVVKELENKYLRVITLEDKITIHNAFPDRRFKL